MSGLTWTPARLAAIRTIVLMPADQLSAGQSALMAAWLSDHTEEDLDALITEAKVKQEAST